MPNPAEKPGGTGITPEAKGQPQADPVDPGRAYFGLGAKEKTSDPSTGTDEGKTKPSNPTGKGDPIQGTTPAEGSSKEGGGKEEEGPQYAGKYETPEALEAGYNNLMSQTTKMSTENRMLKEQVESLTAKMSQLEKAIPKTETTSEKDKANPEELKALRQQAEDELGKEAADLIFKMLEIKTGTSPHEKAALDRVAALESDLSDIRAEQFRRQLIERVPEVEDPDVDAHMQEQLGKVDPNKPDALFLMEVFAKAACWDKILSKTIDKGIIGRLSRMTDKEKQRLIAANLTVGDTPTGQAGPAVTDRTKLGRQYFGLPT
jgi:hypothetical protein